MSRPVYVRSLALVLLAGLAGCTDTHLPASIDVELGRSDDQTLVVQNGSPNRIELVSANAAETRTLQPGEKVEIPFQVRTTGPFVTEPGTAYWVPGTAPLSDELVEQQTHFVGSGTVLSFRDAAGTGHSANLDLLNCGETDPALDWGARRHWPAQSHTVTLPPAMAGNAQPVCPAGP